jgi:hypothetical protein
MPIRLAITRSDGTIERRSYAVDTWLSGARHTAVTIEKGSTVTKVEIDPDQVFPDVNRSNNKWTRASPR